MPQNNERQLAWQDRLATSCLRLLHGTSGLTLKPTAPCHPGNAVCSQPTHCEVPQPQV